MRAAEESVTRALLLAAALAAGATGSSTATAAGSVPVDALGSAGPSALGAAGPAPRAASQPGARPRVSGAVPEIGSPGDAGPIEAPAAGGPGGEPAAAAAASTPAQESSPGNGERAFQEAHACYLAGDFEGAARRYQALVDAGHDGAALHYDLGNAQFRAGRLGLAAAAWERALQRDPGDSEARANLELARRSFSARLPWAHPEPLADRVAARVPDRLAAAGLAVPWIAFWLLLALRLRARGGRRALLGAGAAAAALLWAAAGLVLAGKARALRAPRAVVAVAGAGLHEVPSPSVKASLDLPEGAPLRALGAEGDWLRVRLPGGVEGYVQREELEVLGPEPGRKPR